MHWKCTGFGKKEPHVSSGSEKKASKYPQSLAPTFNVLASEIVGKPSKPAEQFRENRR
jgi:hypothetical protein